MKLSCRRDHETVISVHIPKTGGVTLRSFLSRQYDAEQFRDITGAAWTLRHQFQDIVAAEEDGFARVRLIHAHMPFGLHRSLPQRCAYTTVLRHPVDRIVSHYYYATSTPSHSLGARIREGRIRLEDYCRSEFSAELENGQTRILCGIPEVEVRFQDEPCPARALDSAKDNLLHHIQVVGLTERLDASMMLLCVNFGWTPYLVRPENRTRNRPKICDISSKAIPLTNCDPGKLI